jgi:hypothetical protein
MSPGVKRLFKMLLLAAGLAACVPENERDVSAPPDVLGEEEMAAVLADFAMAESAATLNAKNVRLSATDSVYAFEPLKDNKVTKAQYDSSLAFYVANPKQYKRVYERVLEMLSAYQASHDTLTKK